MVSPPHGPTEPQAGADRPGTRPDLTDAVAAATPSRSLLVRSALGFAARRHARQRRDSDGAPFIAHPLEVARLLRDAGCSEVVIAGGLLHDVLETTYTSVAELTTRFGPEVANLVQAVSDDPSVESYRERKQRLREQVRNADHDAALVFAADKVSKVREQRQRITPDRVASGAPDLERLCHDEAMRLEHYHESLRMLQDVAAGHPLVELLANELHANPMPASGSRPCT